MKNPVVLEMISPKLGRHTPFFGSLLARKKAVALGSAAFLVVASCGKEETKSESCILSYAKVSSGSASEEKTQITYRASMSNECKDVFSKNSGRAKVTLDITSKGAEGMYVEKLTIGERSFDFGSKYSLANATLSSSFTSDTLATWKFPWSDSPGSGSVTIIALKTTEEDKWPTVVNTTIEALAD
jgi:hypothetical protein